MIQDAAELVSLMMSVPTVLLSLVVIFLWEPTARNAFRKKGEWEARDWFIVGVTLGFTGKAIDNLCWMALWSAHFLQTDNAQHLFMLGVFANIPFRQGLSMAAAYCHIRSALQFQKSRACHVEGRVGKLTVLSLVLGGVYVLGLVLVRRCCL